MKKNPDSAHFDAMSRNPNNWRGPFYVNRKDRRVLVPKLNPKMGVTLNFGNPFTYALLLGIFIILVLLLA